MQDQEFLRIPEQIDLFSTGDTPNLAETSDSNLANHRDFLVQFNKVLLLAIEKLSSPIMNIIPNLSENSITSAFIKLKDGIAIEFNDDSGIARFFIANIDLICSLHIQLVVHAHANFENHTLKTDKNALLAAAQNFQKNLFTLYIQKEDSVYVSQNQDTNNFEG